jgi:hypothetical protein
MFVYLVENKRLKSYAGVRTRTLPDKCPNRTRFISFLWKSDAAQVVQDLVAVLTARAAAAIVKPINDACVGGLYGICI